MNRILNIVSKDLLQLVRDWQTFLFLLAMPILFTLMFGLAFGGAYDSGSDPRLPVALIDEDGSSLAAAFTGMLAESEVLRIADDDPSTRAELEEGARRLAAAGLAVHTPPLVGFARGAWRLQRERRNGLAAAGRSGHLSRWRCDHYRRR